MSAGCRLPASRPADQYTRGQYDDPSHDDLEGGLQEWRIHVFRPHPGDNPQFDEDDLYVYMMGMETVPTIANINGK